MKTKLMFILLASLVLGACNSYDDKDDNGGNGAYTETSVTWAPVWQIDWSNNQECPTWTEPDFSSIYENWTILKVQIEETLKPFVSEDDLMALFVNGELRGLSKPARTVAGNQAISDKYVIKAWGNETGSETVNMSLQYYCQTLRHLFTLTDDISLDSDATTGIDEDFIPEFTLGSAKYPVVKAVGVEPLLTTAGLTPVSGNMVGAFVGEECRGTVTLSPSGNTQLVIYGRNTSESFTLKYYDGAAGKLYTILDAVKM